MAIILQNNFDVCYIATFFYILHFLYLLSCHVILSIDLWTVCKSSLNEPLIPYDSYTKSILYHDLCSKSILTGCKVVDSSLLVKQNFLGYLNAATHSIFDVISFSQSYLFRSICLETQVQHSVLGLFSICCSSSCFRFLLMNFSSIINNSSHSSMI